MATTPDENSWLFHELGRCHLELGNYDQAKAHGEKSMTAAQEGGDLAWQLNACVLVGQAEGKPSTSTHNIRQQCSYLRHYCCVYGIPKTVLILMLCVCLCMYL